MIKDGGYRRNHVCAVLRYAGINIIAGAELGIRWLARLLVPESRLSAKALQNILLVECVSDRNLLKHAVATGAIRQRYAAGGERAIITPLLSCEENHVEQDGCAAMPVIGAVMNAERCCGSLEGTALIYLGTPTAKVNDVALFCAMDNKAVQTACHNECYHMRMQHRDP